MNYRQVKAINNSLLSVYEDNYQDFIAYWVYNQPLPQKEEEYLIMGSIVDTLITKPEEYESKYIIFTGKSPDKPQMVSFCNKLASMVDPLLPVAWEILYEGVYNAVGIKSPKLDGFLLNFEPFKDYVQFLIDSVGKQVVTQEQVTKASKIVEQLRTNQYTKDYINATDTKNGVVFNQLELYGRYKGLPLKGAVDKVLVSHKNKTIQPLDLKTSYNVLGFRDSYYKYRYYRQGSYYTYLISEWAKEQGWADYTILPFIFIVCSTSGGQHWLYKMSEFDIVRARSGGDTKWNYPIKGWEQILGEIKQLSEWNEWAYPYECLVNEGVMELNIFK